eukprot:3820261-Prymnesium_polylepis.1
MRPALPASLSRTGLKAKARPRYGSLGAHCGPRLGWLPPLSTHDSRLQPVEKRRSTHNSNLAVKADARARRSCTTCCRGGFDLLARMACPIDALRMTVLTIRIVREDMTILEQAGGHVVSPSGCVVTAAHTFVRYFASIVAGTTRIVCQDHDGNMYSAFLHTGEHQLTATYDDGWLVDVALLRIDGM